MSTNDPETSEADLNCPEPGLGLAHMRTPFPPERISQKPKPTKKQTEQVRSDPRSGIRCEKCGQWHHPDVVHLDYVGHAALTDRLLECDPHWNWEPMSIGPNGLPALDGIGGLWIKLTVCGQTRLGYGSADGKKGGDAIKELIGDALRNAAMRFGAALDLWHKGEWEVIDGPTEAEADQVTEKGSGSQAKNDDAARRNAEAMKTDMINSIREHGAAAVEADQKFPPALRGLRDSFPELAGEVDEEIRAWHARREQENAGGANDGGPVYDDEIPFER